MSSTVTKKDLFVVSLDDIIIDEDYNVRETETPEAKAHLSFMVHSIGRNGVRTPLKGYKNKGKYVITQGHTRIAAIKILKEQGVDIPIPLVPEGRDSDEISRIFDLVTSNSGKPLTMLEKTVVVRRLLEKGLKKKEIADGFGESQANIDHLVKLDAATDKVKDWVREGRISPSSVVDLIREVGSEATEKEVAEMIYKQDKSETTSKKKISKKDVKERNGSVPKISLGEIERLEKQLIDRYNDKSRGSNMSLDKMNVITQLYSFLQGDITEDEFMDTFDLTK